MSIGLGLVFLCYVLLNQYSNHGGNISQVTSPSNVVEDNRENSDTPAPTVTANAETSDTENTFDDVIIKHAYSVDDFRALDITIMELPEYGTSLGAQDNFNISMNIENENICALVWGEDIIINGNDLNRSAALIYPQMETSLQITGGGYRPFAVDPDNGIAYWQSQLLDDTSMKMGGNADKYILKSDGLTALTE